MTDIYIVIKCGEEGIDDILRGFIDPKDAVALIDKERARYDNPSEDDEEFGYYFEFLKDKEEAAGWLERQKRSYCIQRDSGDGFRCVCAELGVNLDDEQWLY